MATKVFVVMGNDFPAAVFSTEERANAYCETAAVEHQRRMRQHYGEGRPFPKIYFRATEFELDAEEIPA
jgi:hypothetical protein